jgi:hypothetical protein
MLFIKKYFIFCSHLNLNFFLGNVFPFDDPKNSNTTNAKKNYLKMSQSCELSEDYFFEIVIYRQ